MSRLGQTWSDCKKTLDKLGQTWLTMDEGVDLASEWSDKAVGVLAFRGSLHYVNPRTAAVSRRQCSRDSIRKAWNLAQGSHVNTSETKRMMILRANGDMGANWEPLAIIKRTPFPQWMFDCMCFFGKISVLKPPQWSLLIRHPCIRIISTL